MYSLTFRVRVTTPPQCGHNGTAHAADVSILSRGESSPACVVCVCGMRAACGGPGGWSLDNSRIRQLADCQLADWTSRGLDNSRTSQLADWTSRGLDNSRSRRCRQKGKLSTQSRRWHPRVVQSATCPVRELSSPRVVQSASWRIRELSSNLAGYRWALPRISIVLPYQRNPCTDCKSAQ